MSGYRVHGTTDELPRVLDDTKPDEVVIAIPSAPGELRLKVVTACRERDIPVRTLPTMFELLSRGPNLLRQVREVQVEDILGREPGADGDRPRGRLPARRAWCSSPARAARSAPSCAARSPACKPKRLVLVDHAENNLFEIRRQLEEDHHFGALTAVLARLQGRHAHARAVRRGAAVGGVPRGGLQARRADGGEPGRGGAQQRRGHPHRGRRRGRGRRRALRARVHRQGRDPGDRDGRLQGAGRVGGRGRPEPLPRDTRYAAVRFGNVLGSSGLGGADLPPPDRRRRAGDGHRREHVALLHDDPGGRAAHHPAATCCRPSSSDARAPADDAAQARSTCSRWATR